MLKINLPGVLNRLFLITIIFFGVGCSAKYQNQYVPLPVIEWKYSDLRVIDLPNINNPHQDIIAAYFRLEQDSVFIRIDFLDHPDINSFDTYLYYSSIPGGKKSLKLDPSMFGDEFIVFRLEKNVLNMPLDQNEIEIGITFPNTQHRIDTIGPFLPGSPPPSQTPILLAFWNFFPAYSPIQIIRSWDGAHSGPFGQRHGLSHLLKSASQYDIPITLLDLKIPRQIILLDLINQSSLLTEMEFNQKIFLPEVVFEDPNFDLYVLKSSEATLNFFGYPSRSEIFRISKNNYQLINYSNVYGLSKQVEKTIRDEGKPALPSQYGYLENSVTFLSAPEGFTITEKIGLLEAAISNDPSRVIIVGGDFKNSIFGDPKIGKNIFSYIRSHPWIKPLKLSEFLILKPKIFDLIPSPIKEMEIEDHQNSNFPDNAIIQTLRESLALLNSNPITDQVISTYLNFFSQQKSPEYQKLSDSYIGLLFHMIAASEWFDHPEPFSQCDLDINFDGRSECIITTKDIFTSYDQNGGSIILTYFRSQKGVFQWIGPQSQLMVGITDPSEWILLNGKLYDPGEISGAFVDPPNLNNKYFVHLSNQQLIFESENGRIQKKYQILHDSILVDIKNNTNYATKIPIIPGNIDAFPLGHRINYHKSTNGENVTFSFDNTPYLNVSIHGAHQEFCSSLDFQMSNDFSEDPNREYPDGYLLPIPMSLISINADKSFTVELTASHK